MPYAANIVLQTGKVHSKLTIATVSYQITRGVRVPNWEETVAFSDPCTCRVLKSRKILADHRAEFFKPRAIAVGVKSPNRDRRH